MSGERMKARGEHISRQKLWTIEHAVYLKARIQTMPQLPLALDHEESRLTTLRGFLLQQHQLLDLRILYACYHHIVFEIKQPARGRAGCYIYNKV